MRQLVLFCGLPGSGKTTISSSLCKTTGASLIDLDDFKKVDVDPNLVTSQIDPPEVRWKYYQKGLVEALRLFADGTQCTVIDEVFHLAILRDQIENFCSAQGVSLLWVEVQCPYEVVFERLHSKPRIGHILSTEEALAMYRLFDDAFEPFTPAHPQHIVIDNGSSREAGDAVTRILQKINWR